MYTSPRGWEAGGRGVGGPARPCICIVLRVQDIWGHVSRTFDPQMYWPSDDVPLKSTEPTRGDSYDDKSWRQMLESAFAFVKRWWDLHREHRPPTVLAELLESRVGSRKIYALILPETIKIFDYSVFEFPIWDWLIWGFESIFRGMIWGGFEFRIRFCNIFFPGF